MAFYRTSYLESGGKTHENRCIFTSFYSTYEKQEVLSATLESNKTYYMVIMKSSKGRVSLVSYTGLDNVEVVQKISFLSGLDVYSCRAIENSVSVTLSNGGDGYQAREGVLFLEM